MATEYELKYRATEEALAAIDDACAEAPIHYQMQTTYYDTPSRALSERHITLRRRMENDISVCALKAPAKLGRAEFELECDSIEKSLPELCKLAGVDPALLSEGIVPVCGARFTRLACRIVLDGAEGELALDEGILFGGGLETPLAEVETELKSGAEAVLVLWAEGLAQRFGLTPEPKSKFRRALDLAKGE